ncbi:MAG TPA: HNH endonuclease signature motif containing protein, partial [Jatrophihabitans sp.]|nr:HNH endonuclease signature motif containing protein [Jatrophihabitans sp.]
ARDLILRARPEVPMWLRRLYLRPKTGDLAALESTRRTFTGNQRRYLQLRDQTCRTPWCEAPIRHIDHLQPHQHGGPTATSNGAGACVACNHTRQAPDWTATVLANTARHTIEITTPTGHRYRSRAPDLPGAPPTPPEERLAQAILAA